MDQPINSSSPVQKAIGILAGNSTPNSILETWCRESDFSIAADSAADKLMAFHFVPDVTIGDLDSLQTPQDQLKKVIQNTDQMTTDCDKLLAFAESESLKKIMLINAEGGLTDHFIAILQSAMKSTLEVRFIFEKGIGVLLRGPIEWHHSVPNRFSLLPMTRCNGVSIQNVRWPLNDAVLEPLGPSSISNESTSESHPVEVKIKSGIALAFYSADVSLGWAIL